jgi:hypothetical protein
MPYTLLAPSLYNLETSTTTNTWTTLQDVSTPSSGQAYVLPPNTVTTIGQTLVLRASGVWSCTGTPTFGLGFYWGGTAGVALAATGATALTTGAGTLTNIPWVMEWWGTFQAVGASGSVIGGGLVTWGTSATAFTLFPFGTPQTAATVNTALPKSLVIGGVCSASSASNQIVVQQFSVQLLN